MLKIKDFEDYLIDENGVFLETYENISEASRKNNISISSISYVCNNKRKTAGGFVWHYA